MTAEDIKDMTDKEVNEEEQIGLRALNGVLSVLPQRKRLELISQMWGQAFDCMVADPVATAQYYRDCFNEE